MKRAVILHAMDQTSKGHWYPWLKQELERRGYEVWMPDLPNTDRPDAAEATRFLLSNASWDFQDNLVIGHSSGAVEALFLLQALPPATIVRGAVLISSFDHPVKGMEAQHDRLFPASLNFAKIRQHAQQFLFVHGDDDPWCPQDGAEYLAKQVGSTVVLVPGGKHFSTSLDPAYSKFPQLIKILEERHLL